MWGLCRWLHAQKCSGSLDTSYINVWMCCHNEEGLWFDCHLVLEPHCGHAQPWGVGHEGETVPHWGWDQDVGHCLLCHTEAVSGRNPQVWLIMALDYIWVFWIAEMPRLQMLAQTNACTNWFVSFDFFHLHLCVGVSQTSCARSRRTLGCPSRVSHVFVNTPREQTVWNPCSDTWKIPMLGCSLSLSSCLERLLSMVSKHLINIQPKYIERTDNQKTTLLSLCPIHFILSNICQWKNCSKAYYYLCAVWTFEFNCQSWTNIYIIKIVLRTIGAEGGHLLPFLLITALQRYYWL